MTRRDTADALSGVTNRVRVIIADDHPVARIGIGRTLRELGGAEVVGEAASVDELLALLAVVPCDVLVTDYSMPDSTQADGEMLLRRLAMHWSRVPVVLMTSSRNVALLSSAVKAGVVAVVDKGAPPETLVTAVRAAANGRNWLDPSLKVRIADIRNLGAKGHGMGALSAAELRVVRLLSEGKTVTGIAKLLHRDKGTISKQKTSAMAKLGVDNDVQLVDVVRGILR